MASDLITYVLAALLTAICLLVWWGAVLVTLEWFTIGEILSAYRNGAHPVPQWKRQ